MVRRTKKLTAIEVKNLQEPGRYHDGDGLYLEVGPTGSKSWIFRFMLNGRRRDMGLGPERFFSLAEARQMAYEANRLRHQGIDPIEARNEQRRQQRVEEHRSATFRECAAEYIEAQRPSWRSKKHAQQWTNTLERYAFPFIGDLSTQVIDTNHVLSVLKPIWYTKSETAYRLRGRIESILDAAKVKGHRIGENPARWKGHLDKLLPAKSKIAPVNHHRAMPHQQLPRFFQELRSIDSIPSLAMQFLILNASRSGEVFNARWEEIDFEEGVWTVPALRMKSNRMHRVPLSDESTRILCRLKQDTEFMFPGRDLGKPITHAAVSKLLKDFVGTEYTLHGFRSSFRNWASEMTNAKYEVVEAALAHKVRSKVEAAYLRTNLLDQRVYLMQSWADYVSKHKAIQLRPRLKVFSG